jgi:prepilin-type N-terminal cleavage/methylation domain-containing protein/prepilin-type processing-associated H-X9-DG protein
MKRLDPNPGHSGLTLVEVLLVMAIIAVLAALFLPPLAGSRKAKVPLCMSNLKQIDIGFNIFASNNHGQFPMEIPVTKGGTMEFIYSGHTFPHFEKLKNYQIQPRLFICPFETNRQAADSYEAFNDLNLSYFVNADASTNDPSLTILIGDRFLQVNGQPVAPGLLAVTTNLNLSWTPNFHVGGGNFTFADGHCEFVRDGNRLKSIISGQPLETNRFSVP